MAWGWGWGWGGCCCADEVELEEAEAEVEAEVEVEDEIGVGSDMRGRMDDEVGSELAPAAPPDCLPEPGAPVPSLADEVRLPKLGWSSACVAVWDF